MLKYAVLILWRTIGVPANFYAFCISDEKLVSLKTLLDAVAGSVLHWKLIGPGNA